MTRRTLYLTLFALVLILLASGAWAKKSELVVTGNFFNPKPGMTTLCAKVLPMDFWEVEFKGETPYGLEFEAAPLFTNSTGRGCIRALWPQGVYKVKAKASEIDDDFEVVQGAKPKSKEDVAVSVFNPYGFCGAQGGGALQLFSYGVPPSVKNTLSPRQATFAFIFKLNVPQNYGVWYFDKRDPDGGVKFVAQSFIDISFDSRMQDSVPYKVVEVRGNGMAEIEDEQNNEQHNGMVEINGDDQQGEDLVPVHYYIYADDYPGDSSFQIVLTDFTGQVLYESALANIGPETTVFSGKNVIQPCP